MWISWLFVIGGVTLYLLGLCEEHGRQAVDPDEEWPPSWLWDKTDD